MKRLVAITLMLSLGVAQGAFANDSKASFFSKADIDNSTSLSKPEFKTFIKLLASSGHKNAGFVKNLRLYRVAWDRVNTDQNNVITPDEINTAKFTQHKQSAAVKLY
ncbi:MAG: hypothetical protein ABJN04_10905 [Hyphomicrobiales bacterium]